MKATPEPAVERRYWPLGQIIVARVREFYREPEALFWVYGFPILMVVGLGIAFRNQPVEQITVDVQAGPARRRRGRIAGRAAAKFIAAVYSEEEARLRLRTGTTALVVTASGDSPPHFDYIFDPSRPESVLARNAVDDALQRAAGRKDVAEVTEQEFNEPGGPLYRLSRARACWA